MCNLKNNTNVYTKQTHRYREQASGYQNGEGRGKGQIRSVGLTDIN